MNTHKQTKVKFLLEDTENGGKQVLAFFPEYFYDKEKYKSMFVSYSTIEQHCPCSKYYANTLEEATQEQYLNLAKELEKIGYNLLIINRNENTHS